jgi:hypothetical protein
MVGAVDAVSKLFDNGKLGEILKALADSSLVGGPLKKVIGSYFVEKGGVAVSDLGDSEYLVSTCVIDELLED